MKINHPKKYIKHSQDADRSEPTHVVNIQDNSVLSDIYGDCAFVNTFHHQAVAAPGTEIPYCLNRPMELLRQ